MADDLLQELLAFQPNAVAMIREKNMAFDKAPLCKPTNEAERWQDLAFWLYTYICEIDSLCRNASEGQDD